MGEGSGIRVRFIKELLDTADKLTFSTQKREKSDVHPISIGTRGGERGVGGGGLLLLALSGLESVVKFLQNR